MKKLFKVVQYQVTDDFGDSDIGEIRNAILVVDDGTVALLYHPSDTPNTCGSFEICKLKKDIYITDHSQPYINSINTKLQDVLLELTKDWKQFIIPPNPNIPKKPKKKKGVR